MLTDCVSGQMDDTHWRPGEVVVWIVTRDERAIRGFNSALKKLQDCALKGRVGREDQCLYEQSVLFNELSADTAGHHAECPSLSSSDYCECEQLGRHRYCRCVQRPETSRIGSCTCVLNALQSLCRSVEDGLPLEGRRPAEDHFVKVAGYAIANLNRQFTEHGLQLLSKFAEIRFRKPDVLRCWPADFTDRLHDEPRLVPPTCQPEHGRPVGYEDALNMFCERLMAGQTKPERLNEVKILLTRLPNGLKRDSITKEVRKFFGYIDWVNRKPTNAEAVTAQVKTYLAERKAVRIAAAVKIKRRCK